MEIKVKKDESLSPFIRGKVNVIQKKKGYRFNIDSVLLSDFFKPKKKKAKIIDLGTGSGIILLLLSLRYPDLEFYALEYQTSLYDIAKRNFKLNNLKVNLIQGDIRQVKDIFPSQFFDYVITNPPYYKKTDKKTSSQEVLLAKTEETASSQDFIKAAFYLLKDSGSFYMINQSNRLPELIFSMKMSRLEPKRLRFIHPTLNENSTHFLVEAVKNAKEGAIIEKPLIIYKDPKNKIYTEEVEELLENF